VNSNDKIFIGNEKFKTEANQLMDFCFSQILEAVTTMNDSKDVHLKELNMICLNTANILVSNTQVNIKKISSFVNRMFKMADTYMEEYNARTDVAEADKITRGYVNKTFEAFKRKKDNQASDQAIRSSIASTSSAASAYVPQ